jgi:ABC-type glycerol-3-phosphate transport system substrate-binding protein
MKKVLTLILVASFAIITIGSKHIIQLPKPVIIGEESEKGKMLSTLEDISETAATDPASLNILFMSGSEAEAARDVEVEFEELFDVNINIYEATWVKAKEIIVATSLGWSENVLDVVVYPSYFIGNISEYIVDLDDYIKKDNFDISDYIPAVFELSSRWVNTTKGIPIQCSIFCIVYRTDIFSEKNLTAKKDWSYQDYYNYMETLSDVNMYGVLFDPSKSILNYYWSNRFWSLGGKTTSPNWEITINNDAGYSSVKMLQNILKYAPADIFKRTYSDIVLEFIAGRAAMLEGFPDFLLIENKIMSDLPIYNNLAILPSPQGSEGNCVQLSSKLISIPKKSIKKEKAWEWIKFYTSKDKHIYFLDKYGFLSPRVSTYNNKDLNEKYFFLKDIYNCFTNSTLKSRWKIPASYEAWEIKLNEMLHEALTDNKSPRETMQKLQEEWESILEYKPPDPGIINIE